MCNDGEGGRGGSPRHLNTFSNLFIVVYTTHISTHAMSCCYC